MIGYMIVLLMGLAALSGVKMIWDMMPNSIPVTELDVAVATATLMPALTHTQQVVTVNDAPVVDPLQSCTTNNHWQQQQPPMDDDQWPAFEDHPQQFAQESIDPTQFFTNEEPVDVVIMDSVESPLIHSDEECDMWLEEYV